MSKQFQAVVRWLLGIFIVSMPLSYILWQWRNSEPKELAGLTYEAFNARMSGAQPPVYWTYALYVLSLVTVVVTATALIAQGLKLVFLSRDAKPQPSPK